MFFMDIFFSFIIPTSCGSALVFGWKQKDVLISKCTAFQPFRYLHYGSLFSVLLAQTSLVTSPDTIRTLEGHEPEEA